MKKARLYSFSVEDRSYSFGEEDLEEVIEFFVGDGALLDLVKCLLLDVEVFSAAEKGFIDSGDLPSPEIVEQTYCFLEVLESRFPDLFAQARREMSQPEK